MPFNEKLASLMHRNGVSNYKLAKYLNCSQTSVKNWVDGKDPKLEHINGIADYFQVSVDYLLDREENEKSPGTDETMPRDEEEREFIRLLRESDDVHRRLAAGILQAAVRNERPAMSRNP